MTENPNFPLTDDALQLIYPDIEIRRGLEELAQEYLRATKGVDPDAERKSANLDVLDAIYRGRDRGTLVRLIRRAKKRQQETFKDGVEALLELSAAVEGHSIADLERSHHLEFLMECSTHGYQRRILAPGQVHKKAKVNVRNLPVRKEFILYAHGDEQISKDEKLFCGNHLGENPHVLSGRQLSQVQILRERMDDMERAGRVRDIIRHAYRALTGGAGKRKVGGTQDSFKAEVLGAISGEYPNIFHRRGNKYHFDKLYEIMENIARHNIPTKGLFSSLDVDRQKAIEDAIAELMAVPIVVGRDREKSDPRLVRKVMKYTGREHFYKKSKFHHPDTNSILPPIDLYGFRGVTAEVPLFFPGRYKIEQFLIDDERFELLEDYKKDRISKPKGTYQSLHLGVLFTDSGGRVIPIELQYRTHEMDSKAEYSDDTQGHKTHEDRDYHLSVEGNPPFMELLLTCLLAPETYKGRVKREIEQRKLELS